MCCEISASADNQKHSGPGPEQPALIDFHLGRDIIGLDEIQMFLPT